MKLAKNTKDVTQAAAIPYRRTVFGTYEVLLVTLSRGDAWGFPKGGIKKGSDPVETALHETLEESGVLGTIETPLGTFEYRKRGKKHAVLVMPLRVERMLDRWMEEERRVRVWVPMAEADRLLDRAAWGPALVRLRHRLLCDSIAVSRVA